MRSNLKIFSITLAAFALDRILKKMALSWLSGFSSESFLVNKYFGLQLFKNKLFLGKLALNEYLAFALLFVFILILTWLLIKEVGAGKRVGTLALALILVGAFSNLLDRVFLGYVVDYLVAGPWVINLSDIFIAAGVLIYLNSKS